MLCNIARMETEKAFKSLESRAARVLLTLNELGERAGMGRTAIWRSRYGKNAREVTAWKVIHLLEATLAKLEPKA